MATIIKKTWPQYFRLVKSGKKKFELRLADFKVKKGDTLVLAEWNPKTKKYTGQKITKKVKYVLKFDAAKCYTLKDLAKYGLYIIEI